MSIQMKTKELIAEFSNLPEWEARYKLLISKGKDLPMALLIPESKKSEDLKVKGCQSQVWLDAELKDKLIYFKGDSDALIVKGLLSLLLYVYSGESPSDILADTGSFIKELGFEKHLSPSRANGLFSMVKQMKFYAMGFQYKLSQ